MKKDHIHCVNTIEGGLVSERFAHDSGINFYMTGVGDKWITWKSWEIFLEKILFESVSYQENKKKLHTFQTLQSKLEQGIEKSDAAKMEVNHKLKAHEVVIYGSETSGHFVMLGFLSSAAGKEFFTFAGDGLKGFLNTLVSLDHLIEDNLNELEFKQDELVTSRYCYYSDREKFKRGSQQHDTLTDFTVQEVTQFFGNGYKIIKQEFMEEPDILYYKIIKDSSGDPSGNIFIRNSGTEFKTG